MPLQSFLYILLLLGLCRAQSCYFPDGSFADGYTPCNSGRNGSWCCKTDSVCLTNGYCMGMSQPYTLYRGACSDSSWSPSSGCNDICSGVPNTRSTGCSIVLYSNVDGNALYCANSIVATSSNSIGCANRVGPFPIPPGNIVPNKAVLANTSSAEPSVPTTTGAASSTGTSSSSSASGTVANVSNHGSGDSKTLAIGVGVGVSLGVLSLVSLIWGVYERRKRQQLLNSIPSMMPMSSDPYTPMPVGKRTSYCEAHELGP